MLRRYLHKYKVPNNSVKYFIKISSIENVYKFAKIAYAGEVSWTLFFLRDNSHNWSHNL